MYKYTITIYSKLINLFKIAIPRLNVEKYIITMFLINLVKRNSCI